MSYARVIPRDLFNESKLLKCLGQLALLIHEGGQIRWPLALDHDGSDFLIERDDAYGDLYCSNLTLRLGDREIALYATYNSKSPYPLYFVDGDTVGDVLDDQGNLNREFINWLDDRTY